MSYDIYLEDPETGTAVQLSTEHQAKGGTYAIGGTTEAWLNVTYNYAGIFNRLFGDKGIRTIYGVTAEESIQILEAAVAQLDEGDVNDDYWFPCEGNAAKSLRDLISLAKMAPAESVWRGD